MIRIGTIGTSQICEHFLDGIALTGRFELCAVYSRNSKTGNDFAKKHSCNTVFTNLNEMASWDGIDAVYIASPNVFHAQQTRIFLENNKHVICEKPITTSVDEYLELKALADAHNVIYMEAIMSRHIADYKKIKTAIGSIGKVLSARIDFSQRSSRLDRFLSGDHVNIFDMSLYAGTLMDLGVYCVYAAIDLLGVPNSITAKTHYLNNGADGSGVALFEYDDFTATLTYSKICQGEIGSEIIGTNGSIKIKSISQYAGITLVRNGIEEELVASPTKAQVMSGEAMHFADYIENYDENKDDYMRVSLLCENVHRSMDKIKQSAGIKYV